MVIENNNGLGKLPVIELEDFEKVNNIKLPKDYRAFLLEFNGGKPMPNVNPDTTRMVSYILGMHNDKYDESIYRVIEAYAGRLPFDSFPIARDPFGNLYLMSFNNEQHGFIYFWYHECESPVPDGNYVKNCHFVACSFTQFLEGLKETVI
jgi:hypothetical protein